MTILIGKAEGILECFSWSQYEGLIRREIKNSTFKHEIFIEVQIKRGTSVKNHAIFLHFQDLKLKFIFTPKT
jgi:hypothetical protein